MEYFSYSEDASNKCILMVKYFSFLFLHLMFISNLFSQEIKITTKFSQMGSLSENLSENPPILTEFKENEVCIVVDYLGKDNYKINYKKLIGFVKSEYLFVNDDMIELVIAYEDKIKIEAIEKENKRKQEVEELIRKSEEEKQRQPIMGLKSKVEEVNKKQRDSIANGGLTGRQNLEAGEFKTEREQELNKSPEDSIIKVRVEDKHIKETLDNQEKTGVISIKNQEASIVNIEQEKKRKEEEVLIKKREETLKKAKEDSKLIASRERGKGNDESPKSDFRDLCQYAVDEFDPFYSIRIIRTSPFALSENLKVELYRQAHRTNVFFNLSEDLGCASYIPANRSSVKVTLENDTVVTFYHSWDIDCGDFSFKGNLSDSDIERLKKSPIKSIILKGTKGSYNITSLDYKDFFIDKLKCIE